MRRKKNEEPIKDVIQRLLQTYKLNGRINNAKIIDNWEKMMGKTIAKHTTGLYIKQGILYVRINSASLKQEMFLHKKKIKQIVNNFVGSNHIDDISFF
jgi:predicted nucleic acid-binding Zn ribbon protein